MKKRIHLFILIPPPLSLNWRQRFSLFHLLSMCGAPVRQDQERRTFLVLRREIMNYPIQEARTRILPALVASILLLVAVAPSVYVSAQNAQARTPAETVREFYRMMRERKFREAFALSIYRPAIEPLSAEEFEDLRPDFERMAAAIPEKIEVSGEQTSGDVSTVFVKIVGADASAPEAEPVGLMRDAAGGGWVIGDKENMEVVKKAGKQFFFEARIQTHHSEVQAMLQRINIAQQAYTLQNKESFADLPTLIKAGLVPKDIEATDLIGYRFHVELSKDAKSWTARAEPLTYNRTGRLSFFMDQTGIRSADIGGKPLILPAGKQ
jgi:hypothetical protein